MRSLLNKKSFLSVLLLGGALLEAHSQTTVLFNSLGGRPAGSDLISEVGPIGASFSSGAGGLDVVNIGIGLTDLGVVGAGTTTVSLYGNNPVAGGPEPGAWLASLGSISDSQLSSTYQDYDFPLASPIALAPDTRYWIVLTGSATSIAQWAYTSDFAGIGVASEYFNNSGGTQPNTTGPYQLEVSAVPEPSSLALLGLGLFASGGMLRRKLIVG